MTVFHYVVLRTSCHATEDPERVRKALEFALGRPVKVLPANEVEDGTPAGRGEEVVATETRLQGHFGNRIRLLEVKLERNPDAEGFFRRLAEADPKIPETVLRQLDRRLDPGLNLYLRLGKQEAYDERLVLGLDEDAIQIRAKIAAFPAKEKIARKVVTGFLEDLLKEARDAPSPDPQRDE